MSNNIPIMDKEYYKEIVIDFLTTHKKTWSKEEIEEIADMRAEAFVETNEGIDKSNDGQGSILPTDVRVLNEEPAPALVEVQVSSNDDKSFNKNQKIQR